MFALPLKLSSLAILALSLGFVDGQRLMRRPDNVNIRPKDFPKESTPVINTLHRRAGQKNSFAYFTNWGIYGANFQPQDIVSSQLTHILYSFADTASDTGVIKLTDSYADQEKHYPTDSWSETGNNLYGCLKQLYLLKLKQRNLKVLLSIGGWTYSQAGHFNFVTNPSSRANFVTSAVQLVEDYGFDGIDIDYEYPANAAQGQGLADLVTELRTAFKQLQARKGDSVSYLITAAVGAGPSGYTFLNIPQLNAGLDFWNLMAYDYAGSWLTYSDNQANIYGGARTGFSTDLALQYYLSHGASASKINMGIPLYGHAFENTAGLGLSYSGIGPGSIEAGIYSYKALPLAGAQVFENFTDVSSYSFDKSKGELVSYDTPNIVRTKAQFINARGLAGAMFWELSTDAVGSTSLVGISANTLGSLDSTANHINFPNSKWDNLRNNFAGGGTGTTVSPTAPSSTPTGGSGCGGAAAWSSTKIYVGGDTATFGGHLWSASWWTQGDTPGGAAGVWVDKGAC